MLSMKRREKMEINRRKMSKKRMKNIKTIIMGKKRRGRQAGEKEMKKGKKRKMQMRVKYR